MSKLQKWKTLTSQLVLNDRWCRVRRDEVELPNGCIVDDYFVNLRPDIALIVPITPDRELVMVRQYRHGVGEILIEFPAGAFDSHQEDSQQAAMRELQEETGYTASSWVKLGTLYDNPVKDTNKIHIFLAQSAIQTTQQVLDLTEDIELLRVPLADALNWMLQGQICVSGSIAALTLAFNYLNSQNV